MRLVDYRVRVVNSEAGTAARIRVVIESADRSSVWGTVGVSENIIEASWMALVDAIRIQAATGNELGPPTRGGRRRRREHPRGRLRRADGRC